MVRRRIHSIQVTTCHSEKRIRRNLVERWRRIADSEPLKGMHPDSRRLGFSALHGRKRLRLGTPSPSSACLLILAEPGLGVPCADETMKPTRESLSPSGTWNRRVAECYCGAARCRGEPAYRGLVARYAGLAGKRGSPVARSGTRGCRGLRQRARAPGPSAGGPTSIGNLIRSRTPSLRGATVRSRLLTQAKPGVQRSHALNKATPPLRAGLIYRMGWRSGRGSNPRPPT